MMQKQIFWEIKIGRKRKREKEKDWVKQFYGKNREAEAIWA
jgi:hypothetical protein